MRLLLRLRRQLRSDYAMIVAGIFMMFFSGVLAAWALSASKLLSPQCYIASLHHVSYVDLLIYTLALDPVYLSIPPPEHESDDFSEVGQVVVKPMTRDPQATAAPGRLSLVVLGIYRGEAHVVCEWIEHYLAEGANRIFLVDGTAGAVARPPVVDRYPNLT